MPGKTARLEELEAHTSDPNFWNNAEQAQRILKERSDLATQLERYNKLTKSLEDYDALLDLFRESNDQEIGAECEKEIKRIETEVDEVELQRMFVGQHDKAAAIVEINPGAGGTEAQDWGDILLRMYLRWAERHGMNPQIINYQPGDGAGLKNATVIMSGANAFGLLRAERGVHRLVRISPFDSNARRHTSFASVSVMPDIEEEIKIEIRDEDLRVDTYRSSGAGGQHVNKTDSAVRLTHLPTGLVVACQNERSQHKNKATAMKLLKAKIYNLEMAKQKVELDRLAGDRKKIEWGSQIRSYVLQPYQLIKDLRTEVETSNIQGVLDGDIDQFIRAYLLSEEFNQPE